MRDLLFLAHRIPFPPDKGDKIRSFHFLRGLSQHFRVHLGAFVDDPLDFRHAARLEPYCASLYLPRLRPWVGQLRGLPSTVRGAPLSLARYEHARFARWVSQTLRQKPVSHVFAFSSAVGRYGLSDAPRPLRRIMDFVDVDSEKWRQYAQQSGGAMRRVYDREYRTLAAEEARLARAYDASVLVSPEEAELFRRQNPESAERIHAVSNGVDTAYFDPRRLYPSPFAAGSLTVVFTGAMDYQANVDGMSWFCAEVWPRVRAAVPAAELYIVGQRPVAAVHALARRFEGVTVTGRVPDVRPYLANANVVCAPLRVARGVQNKVLEALAMERQVVGTSAAWEGLGMFNQNVGERVDESAAFARAVIARLSGAAESSTTGRCMVRERFSWDSALLQLLDLLDSVPVSGKAAPRPSRVAAG